jgi:hypothetical protein
MTGHDKHAEREWSQSPSMPRRGRYFIPRQKRHDLFPWPARAFAVAYAAFIVFCIFKCGNHAQLRHSRLRQVGDQAFRARPARR